MSDSTFKVRSVVEIKSQALDEQLDQLCRLEIDTEFFTVMSLAEPLNKEWADRKLKGDSQLKEKRRLVEVCKKQVQEAIKEEGNKNGTN